MFEARISPAWRMPLLCAGAALLFMAWPGIDLVVSSWFYTPGEGFKASEHTWVKLLYELAPLLLNALTACVLLAAILGLRRRYRSFLRPALFVLAVFLANHLIGGLLLKDHWGRARPVQVVQFGGDKTFTPAWIISDQCDRNCSFVSGHASGAFAWMALAWVFPRRRRAWLLGGLAWGALIGLVRLLQGGHFLSDVIFSGLLVYLSADLLARFVFYRSRPA